MKTCRNLTSCGDSQAELRARYIKAMKAHAKACKRAEAAGLSWLDPGFPRGPDLAPFCHLRCGAKGKRTGKPCPHTSIYANSRCKWHGGLSTGPRTAQGKARAALNGRRAGEPVDET